jgi:triacylglycerol lipase
MFDNPNLLSPDAAARAATDVYTLRPEGTTIRSALTDQTRLGPAALDPAAGELSSLQQSTAERSDFLVGADARITGVTGVTWAGRQPPAFLQSRTGFGFVARGRPGATRTAGGANFDNDVLISIRGTEFLSADDWATNFTISDEPGPGGFMVHAGFHRAYQSMADQINSRIATLVAAYLAAHPRKFDEIFLYTFGAPRVGDANFGDWLQRSIGANRMIRVYHPADPVPMIPLYPYQQPDMLALKVAAPEGALIAHNYHGMIATYGPAMRDIAWNDLLDNRARQVSDDQIRWYLEVGFATTPILMMSASVMSLAVRALQYILAAIRGAMGAALDRRLTRSAHTLDTLAAALVLGLEVGGTIAGWVTSLLRTIARLIGVTIEIGQDITRWFIRYLLESLLRLIGRAALRAIRLTLR